MAGVSPCAKIFTPKRGNTWRISTCTPACIADRRRKRTSSNIFASHEMVQTLERAGFIRRQPGAARSIEVHVDPKFLPELL
jgi:SOS-response transcriptional repressor LexA